MTGSRDLFAELDLQVCGTVKFGDGSITKIEGRGDIILACKNGGHRTLTNIYFIPRLKASIISLGQLDETGCRIDINHGMLRIHDKQGLLLAKVQRNDSRLYHLQLRVRQPCASRRHAPRRHGCGMAATVTSTSVPSDAW
jgi:hypothetical protein